MRVKAGWAVLGLLCLMAGLWLWRGAHTAAPPAPTTASAPAASPARVSAPSPVVTTAPAPAIHAGTLSIPPAAAAKAVAAAPSVRNRLSNTTESERELLGNDRAILLANALIDTSLPLGALNIPDNLRAPADNTSWIVQANGPLDANFRALLAGAGVQVISYIPNNAELVLAPGNTVQQLAGNPLVASVLPYAPYYKLTDPALLQTAVSGADLPADVGLRVSVYAGATDTTVAALNKLGADVVASEPSAFGGTTLTVHPASGTFVNIAQLPGVMVMESVHQRSEANDLMRQRLAVSTNTVTNVDYLGLSGLNVFVNVNDSDVDAGHPDLSGRIILDPNTAFGTDPVGHGTHVIGTILGNGSKSSTVGTNASGSVTNANFRGMANNAEAFVIGLGFEEGPQKELGFPVSDAYLQETAGRTNTFISNNSWDYDGDAQYDMAAASYDAAVRDAVPEITGPQPLLYVFSAGNSGGGGTDGSGGTPDSILSPATAKNVITVGAIEQPRNITNKDVVNGATNQPWLSQTDSSNQVAYFSSRGNVGVGIEGPAGRFKPDVVAPGEFVLSDKSEQWDQAGYYNPTNFSFDTQFNQSVTNGGMKIYSTVLPENTTAFTITLLTNDFSPNPFPTLPIFVSYNGVPTTNGSTVTGTSPLTLTPAAGLPLGTRIFYGVGDATNGFVSYDLQTLVESTNNNGTYLTVLSNLNSKLGPWYRYESGTSMSAAGVSGTLALMQEFFEQRLQLTNHSPALMKALLINGSRTVSSQYDFNVSGAVSSQGWGLPNIANSIPGVLTNGGATPPLQFFDETTNMLATGQSATRTLTLAKGTGTQPLRVTLVWTDPPGNPAAGVKLVNNLDLIVSNIDNPNLTNQVVFYGNDIPSGSDYNTGLSPTNTPVLDLVNNVQNVYLFPPLGTNYTITVYGRRVNVNAVDANTNNVVQDYALVVSYGDAGVATNPFTLGAATIVSSNTAALTTVSNGIPLLNQRVGGNSQFAETNGNTNGVIGQWQFYVFTNTLILTNAAYTNVAFVTFDPPELGVPRMGTREEADPANGVRPEADIDLFVSQDPTLTNLNPAAVNASFQSVSRTGTEKVLLSNQNATSNIYYVGVKSEDQEGAQYGFVAVALTNSFDQQDSNGNVTLTIIAPVLPTPIPTGSATDPGSVTVLALTTANVMARKVVVEDTIQHQEFGDLVGAITHVSKTVVLNNHSFFVNPADTTETFLYDDTGEVADPYLTQPPFSLALPPPNTVAPRHSDGPGTLESFSGDNVSDGIWTFTEVNDSSPSDTGFIKNFIGFIEPESPTNGFDAPIAGDSWHYGVINVPANATNLTINVGITAPATGAGPVDLYLRRGAFPDAGDFDKFQVIPPTGGQMTLGLFDSPPLNPGTYYVGVFNPNPITETVNVYWTFGLAAAAAQPLTVVSIGNEPILDDAVTYSTNHVGVNSQVVSAEVGVRIQHPRESDLVLTLIDPQGTRVMLAENRGGLDTNGYGSGVNTTNYFQPTPSTGTYTGAANTFNVGTNQGTLLVNYDFFTQADDMRIYYDGARIFDSGLISGSGIFSVDFGPGVSSTITIDMDEPGTDPLGTNGDAWQYQVSEITKSITYATFTEDTNKTTTPIKFAVPPFGSPAPAAPAPVVLSSFEASEGTMPQDYSNTVVSGWTVGSNPVTVVSVSALAGNEGNALAENNVLALHFGTLTRQLATTPGQTYTLSFVSHGRPEANGPVGWWKGELNTVDSSMFFNDGNFVDNGGYAPGVVGEAFGFNGTGASVVVPDSPSLRVTSKITTEAWINTEGGLGSPPDQSIIAKVGNPAGLNIAGYQFVLGGNVLGGLFNAAPGNPWPGPGSFSTTIPITLGTWCHVAWTYDQNVTSLYFNGQLIASKVVGALPIAATTNNLHISGDDGAHVYFNGLIDEATVYNTALSILQIQDIYAAGSAGKWLPSESSFTVAANLTLGGGTITNVDFTGADYWATNYYTFTAVSNMTPLQIQYLVNNDGILLDSFQLAQQAAPNTNNFYLPEQSLNALAGQNSQGDWKLEVLDNRLGATNPTPSLISWQLSLALDRVAPATIPLTGGVTNTNTVAPGFIAYYAVYVPPWAQVATNFLTVLSNGPVSLLFNQNTLPGLTNGDVTLINNTTTGGTFPITSLTTPPLLPGNEYYLGVTNSGTQPATFTLSVNFGVIPTLQNLVPVSSNLAAISTDPQYYQFYVNASTPPVSFLLYDLTGNAELVASQGYPLPTTSSYNYISANPGTQSDVITVTSTSSPVPLSPGWWYLGVYNTGTASPLNYTIEAAVLSPTILTLTNDQRFTTNMSPLAAQETFFQFDITTAPDGALFELYNLSDNVDLALDEAVLPYAPPYLGFSANPGTTDQQIVIRTNTTGPANLNGLWYLATPNAQSNVTYTIHAVVTGTNGLLVSAVPISPMVTLPVGGGTGPTLTWYAVNGECYEVDSSTDLINWNPLPVFPNPLTASGQTASITDPTPISGVPHMFYRITQVVCP